MHKDNLEQIIQLRHFLHQHPNLSGQETETIETLQSFLRARTSLEIVTRDGWFYVIKRGTSDKKPIAFRADMDALPMNEGIVLPYSSVHEGISHKCGHDGHMAALCGFALNWKKLKFPVPYTCFSNHLRRLALGPGNARILSGRNQFPQFMLFITLATILKGVLFTEGD